MDYRNALLDIFIVITIALLTYLLGFHEGLRTMARHIVKNWDRVQQIRRETYAAHTEDPT